MAGVGPGSMPARSARSSATTSPIRARSSSWASGALARGPDGVDPGHDLVGPGLDGRELLGDLGGLVVVAEQDERQDLAGDVAVLAPAGDLAVDHVGQLAGPGRGLGALVELRLPAGGGHAAERAAAVDDRHGAGQAAGQVDGQVVVGGQLVAPGAELVDGGGDPVPGAGEEAERVEGLEDRARPGRRCGRGWAPASSAAGRKTVGASCESARAPRRPPLVTAKSRPPASTQVVAAATVSGESPEAEMATTRVEASTNDGGSKPLWTTSGHRHERPGDRGEQVADPAGGTGAEHEDVGDVVVAGQRPGDAEAARRGRQLLGQAEDRLPRSPSESGTGGPRR